MEYSELIARIVAVIKENGNKEITGDQLQGVLFDMVGNLGSGYQFGGIVTPLSNPGRPDAKMLYLAFEEGEYEHLGGLTLSEGMGIFTFDSAWHLEVIEYTEREYIERAFEERVNKTTAQAEVDLKADELTPAVPPMVTGSARGILGRSAAARFLYRQTSSGSGAAWLRSIHGRTVSINQLVLNGDFADGKTGWNGTGSVTNGIYTVTWPAQYSNNGIYQYNRQIRTIIGHKYYVRAWIQNLEEQARSFYLGIPYVTSDRVARTYAANEAAVMSGVYTATGASTADGSGNAFKLYSSVGSDASIKTTGIMVIDLTQAGLDGIITAPEQFEAWQMEQFGHKGYLGYTPGTLVSVNPTGMLTTGRNLFDESTLQNDKWIANLTGEIQTTVGRRASEVYFKCLPSTDYYMINTKYTDNYTIAVWWYDDAKNYLRMNYISRQIFTSPSNAAYFRIGSTQLDGNLCINISDPSFNGQYVPYNGVTTPLDFTEHFATGMNGVNGIYDEVVSDENGKFTDGEKRFGKVDLGDLTWIYNAAGFFLSTSLVGIIKPAPSTLIEANIICGHYHTTYWNNAIDKIIAANNSDWIRVADSSMGTDPAAFKTAMSGVPLIFELATPQHVTFTDPSDAVYPVAEGGTEQVLPVNGKVPTTISPDMTLQMPRILGKETPTMGTLDNFLAAIGPKIGKTITKEWDPETHSYQFEIQ